MASREANPTPPIDREEAYARAKRRFALAVAAVAAGLAIAGSLDRTAGGVVLLAGWIGAVGALHRLGRAGTER